MATLPGSVETHTELQAQGLAVVTEALSGITDESFDSQRSRLGRAPKGQNRPGGPPTILCRLVPTRIGAAAITVYLWPDGIDVGAGDAFFCELPAEGQLEMLRRMLAAILQGKLREEYWMIGRLKFRCRSSLAVEGHHPITVEYELWPWGRLLGLFAKPHHEVVEYEPWQ